MRTPGARRCVAALGVWLAATAAVVALPKARSIVPQERASKRIAESSSVFSVELIRTVLGQSGGNTVVSPLSVSAMLAMVAQGAGGNSSAQLEHALRASAQELRDGYNVIVHSLKNRKTKSALEFGNSVFVSNELQVMPKFKEELYKSFLASIEPTNFKAPEQAARRINRWVAQATRDRIPDLIHPAAIRPRTEMVLANAIFFRGVWLRTFNVNKTYSAPFSPTPSTRVKAPFMHQIGRFRGGEDPTLGAKWVELPFDGEEFSMVLVLPSERHGLDALLTRMTSQHLTNMLNTRTSKQVILNLPRFRLVSAISLVSALQAMGITDIFNAKSDLSGITTNSQALLVSDIIHKAQIEVNEEGSSASAASAVLVNTLSLNSFMDDLPFMADHPFLAIILDRVNSLPLFAGRVSNPLA
ncbi:hypothetical protein R5R35_007542 [Gryllus longicercus]